MSASVDIADNQTDLIMTPRQHDIFEATVRLVYPVLGRVDGVVEVRVRLKGAGVDDLVRVRAADDEGIADNIPLALGAVEVEELAKIVDEACDLEKIDRQFRVRCQSKQC